MPFTTYFPSCNTEVQIIKELYGKKTALAIPPQQTKFRGTTAIAGEFLLLESPQESLRKFISDKLLELIVKESIRYSVSQTAKCLQRNE